MITRETAITLPIMIVIYEEIFFRKVGNLNWKHLITFLLTLLIIPLILLIYQSQKVGYIRGVIDVAGSISPIQYALTEIRVMVTYLRLFILPINQNIDYVYPISKSIFELPTLFSFLFLTGILLTLKHLMIKHRLIVFSIIWFFVTSLPEAIPFPIKDVIFEHRLYLPMVGLSILLVSSGYYCWGRFNFKSMMCALILMIAFYSFLTYQRNKIWANDLALWGDTVKKSQKARVYNNLGVSWYNKGKFNQAMDAFNRALVIDPNYERAKRNKTNLQRELMQVGIPQ
jgi:hypothetical protein